MSSIIFFIVFSGSFIAPDVAEYLGVECELNSAHSPKVERMAKCQ